MNLIEVNDPGSEILAPFGNLKNKKHENHIVIDGSQTLENLLLQGATPRYVVATDHFYQNIKTIPQCPLYVAPRELLESLIGFRLHQGVLALFDKPANVALTQLEDRVLCLNGLTGPENVGTIIRSLVAFGMNSLLVDSKTVSPYSRRVARVSMGTYNRIKLCEYGNVTHALESLKKAGYTIIGTRNAPGSQSISTFKFPQKFVLVIGSEGRGMDLEVEALCDVMIKISIEPGVDSLNAAQAASIILHRVREA